MNTTLRLALFQDLLKGEPQRYLGEVVSIHLIEWKSRRGGREPVFSFFSFFPAEPCGLRKSSRTL